VGGDLVQRAFLLQGSVMLASAINESVASHLHQKGSKVSGIGESPSCLAKAAQDIGPDRLNDVHGVKLGPQRAGQLAPDCHPKIGFIREECSLGGNDISIVQALDQLIQMVDAHVRFVDQLPGSSGKPRSSSLPRGFCLSVAFRSPVLDFSRLRATSTAATVLSSAHESGITRVGPCSTSCPIPRFSS